MMTANNLPKPRAIWETLPDGSRRYSDDRIITILPPPPPFMLTPAQCPKQGRGKE